MKKAQVQQVFIYIMVILVVGTILLLGFRAIMNIMDKACDVNEVVFKKELEDTMSKYSRMGNLGRETIKVPCNYDELCFTSQSEDVNCDQISVGTDDRSDRINQVLKTECEAGTGNNVFITQGQYTTPLFTIDKPRNRRWGCVLHPTKRKQLLHKT
jgi:hypothetical protein